MGERAKEINFNGLRGKEELVTIKSIFSRNNITPVTGSMLAEMFDDVPEVFKNGRFIIADTKYQGRIGMVNPKDNGIRIEYIDLFTGSKERIAIGDIEDKMAFHQCMNVLNGRGNTREILGSMAKNAGRVAVDFAKGPGKAGAKKVGKTACSTAIKFRKLCDWVVIDDNRKDGRG